MAKKLKVINLFAGAGAGKSTTAAGLFFQMKSKGFSVELVSEYAKELVWAERTVTFRDQLYILAKQNHRLTILQEKVDFAINDSPLLLSHIYISGKPLDGFLPLVNAAFGQYDNFNYFINRVKPYVQTGRIQNEEGARENDTKIKKVLLDFKVPFKEINGDNNAPTTILDDIQFNTWPNIQ